MIRQTTLATLLFACVAGAGLATPAVAAEQAARARVIFQVSDNDPAKWNLALNNARNVQADLGKDNADIEIVAFGPGIGMLKADALVANRVGEAAGNGVKVMACENTMKNQKISRDDMHSGISYVKAGVVEIMQKQAEGWAYIRP